jgi:hypothetical protein
MILEYDSVIQLTCVAFGSPSMPTLKAAGLIFGKLWEFSDFLRKVGIETFAEQDASAAAMARALDQALAPSVNSIANERGHPSEIGGLAAQRIGLEIAPPGRRCRLPTTDRAIMQGDPISLAGITPYAKER